MVMSPSQDSWMDPSALVCISPAIKRLSPCSLKGASLPHEREERSALREGVPELFLAVFPRPWKRPGLLKEEVAGREDRGRLHKTILLKANSFLPFPGHRGSNLPFPDQRKGKQDDNSERS